MSRCALCQHYPVDSLDCNTCRDKSGTPSQAAEILQIHIVHLDDEEHIRVQLHVGDVVEILEENEGIAYGMQKSRLLSVIKLTRSSSMPSSL